MIKEKVLTLIFKRWRASFVGTKFGGGGKARAGREFLLPTPLFLPAPPERNFSEISVGIFAEIGSDFI
ncbi:MAG: hypothetical protein COS47_00460 [Candidatus Nealsonbacteria bacterium CG03_land_8_20_14_0_80_36_12]|uniref:Uncharacterized protein n=1 Tax=Candidatus Nealsonbacteria bacterium CG03_land_8_20_14_0_80_36_12 TaxID=1974701 RepID=A0A2M7BYS0_9BACT|nr:MAG: hypothetical protein COS47_00460 [Candidatus Nealsonbacteria bacterium CG03_land_8_20_14_0_80_36_12]